MSVKINLNTDFFKDPAARRLVYYGAAALRLMKLSVIIPTHKRADTLRECLAHLERQTMRDSIEVIVVSDGHDDETAALFGGSGGRGVVDWKIPFRFFEIEKSQQGVARNKGVQEARGEYVLFGQDDIFLAADVCEKHMKVLGQNQSCAVLGFTTWDPALKITPVMKWLEKSGWQFGYPQIAQYAHKLVPQEMQHRFTYTSHISLPRDVASRFPFLSTDIYGWEDIEWGKRLAENGVRLFYEPDAKAWHHHTITMEESLKRMETLGASAMQMAKRSGSFDRVPQGWKLAAYHLLSLLPTMRGRHAKAFLLGMRVS